MMLRPILQTFYRGYNTTVQSMMSINLST